jgi:hypothetical protein
LCGSFPEVPFARNDAGTFNNKGLINLSSIGVDGDGDGVVDVREVQGPNGGDANIDTVQDSSQQHVAAYVEESSGYTVLESEQSTPLAMHNTLGITYQKANADESGVTDDRDFEHGYAGFNIQYWYR